MEYPEDMIFMSTQVYVTVVLVLAVCLEIKRCGVRYFLKRSSRSELLWNLFDFFAMLCTVVEFIFYAFQITFPGWEEELILPLLVLLSFLLSLSMLYRAFCRSNINSWRTASQNSEIIWGNIDRYGEYSPVTDEWSDSTSNDGRF